MTGRVELTALYVPGDRPDRFDKAAGSGADIVILDLEDAVHPARKVAAREHVCAWLAERRTAGRTTPPVEVRVNGPGSLWFAADLAAMAAALSVGRRTEDADVSVRLAKTQRAADVAAVVAVLGSGVPVHPIIETALGIESAYEIATHAAVASLALGEADLASDLRASAGPALDWARSRVVVAARAAGLPAPMMAVYARLGDDEGLTASCHHGRRLGFVGRAAIHPQQLPVIVAAFRPTAPELAHARSVVDALSAAANDSAGVTVLPGGEMLDPAMAGLAREVVDREAAVVAALARFGD